MILTHETATGNPRTPVETDMRMIWCRLARLHDAAVDAINADPQAADTLTLIAAERQAALAVVGAAIIAGREILAGGGR